MPNDDDSPYQWCILTTREDSEHPPKREFGIACKAVTLHKYVHRSWTCSVCGRDEWL